MTFQFLKGSETEKNAQEKFSIEMGNVNKFIINKTVIYWDLGIYIQNIEFIIKIYNIILYYFKISIVTGVPLLKEFSQYILLYQAIRNNIVAIKTTELVLLFHKNITKLVFLWPNISQKKHQSVKLN